MKKLIIKIMNKVRGIKKISEEDQAQAHIMGMALAGLKAAQINASLIAKQGVDIEKLKKQLINADVISANYALAATDAKRQMEKYDAGSIEYEAMLLMSGQLFQLADSIKNEKRGGNEPR